MVVGKVNGWIVVVVQGGGLSKYMARGSKHAQDDSWVEREEYGRHSFAGVEVVLRLRLVGGYEVVIYRMRG